MRHWTGVIPPPITPLLPDGEVDTRSLERVVAHLLDGGVDGIFALGSTGETVHLTDERRDTVLRTVVGTVAGQVPVLAGCIEPTTARVAERARIAQELGAAAVVATAPFYAMVGPHEVRRHFRAVAEMSELPVIAYDIPPAVHVKLGADMVLELAADGLLAGVKDSSGDDVAFRQLRVGRDERGVDLAVVTGHEVVVDAMLLAGADGVVPGLGNIDPAGYARLYAACREGRWSDAVAEQDRLVRLFRVVGAADPATTFGNTRGVGGFKAAAWLLGLIDHPTVSLPMRELAGEELDRVRTHLRSAGLEPQR